MKRTIRAIAVALAVYFSAPLQAQISYGGQPYSFAAKMNETGVQTVKVKAPTQQAIDALVAENDRNGNYPKVGVETPVNLNPFNSGTWTNFSNGDRLWRINLTSQGAQAIALTYSNFFLPEGSKMYVYNKTRDMVLGAFTSYNNHPSHLFSTGIVVGDEITVEYFEPAAVKGQGTMTIQGLVHVFRFMNPLTGSWKINESDPCQVNVNCTPEGTNWQDEKRGVVRILLKEGASWGLCTGSVVNNLNQDCTPYVLTALHCGPGASVADRNQWLFYYNYEAPGCTNPSTVGSLLSQSMTGCSQVATANDGGGNTGSDFQLMLLNNNIPAAYNAYYNGWNANTTATTGGVGIHHPSGDIKKISTFTGTTITSGWNGNGLTSHWRLSWVATTNGHGVTEGGSSGSPLFNNSGLIVGTLTGGSSYCSTPTSPDFYGKMSYHWDQNTTPGNIPLKNLLDPGNTGVRTLSGTYAPCNSTSPPSCAFTASTYTVVAGGAVNFTDQSSGVPTSWSWNFGGGGTPNSSTVQNPTGIVFNTPGTYTVTLTATNANGSCNSTQTITVIPSTGCDTLNYPPTGTLAVYTTGTANKYVVGWNQYEDQSKAQYFGSHTPYTAVTSGFFYFYNVQSVSGNATVRFRVWDATGAGGSPGAVLDEVVVPLSAIQSSLTGTPNQGIIQITFNQPVNVGAAPFYMGFTMENFAANDIMGFVSNTIGDNVPGGAWEQASVANGGGWFALNDGANSFGVDLDMFVSALMTDIPVNANITATPTSACVGNTIVLDGSISSNATGYTWTMPGASPNTSTATSQNVNYGSAGTYTVYLEADGACGGYSVDSLQVTINANPTANASANSSTFCSGQTISLSTPDAGAGHTYAWTGPNGFTSTNRTPSISNATTAASGTYNVTVTNTATGCSSTSSVSVTVAATPSAAATANSTATSLTICAGTTLNFSTPDAGTGHTYAWTGPNGFTSASRTPSIANPTTAATGTYTVTVTNTASGCNATSTVNVTVNARPSHTATSTQPTCGSNNGSITVNATGGTTPYQYSINNGSSYQSSNTFSGLNPGTYTVIVQSANGCTSTSSTVTLNASSALTQTSTSTAATCGQSNGTVTIAASGATLPYQYSLNGGTQQTSNTFTGLAAGTYSVQVVSADGCSATGSVTVGNNSPTITVTQNTSNPTCGSNNGSITITASGGATPYQYSINNGSSFQASNTFTNLGVGTYSIVVADNNGCTGTSSVSLSNVGAPTISSTTPTAASCSGICDGTVTVNATGTGSLQYSIDGGPLLSSSTFTGICGGSHTIMVQDGNGCQTSSSVSVANGAGVTASVTGNTTICSGASTTLTASGGTSYSWNSGQTTAAVTVSPATTTTYTVTVSNASGCNDQASITVNVTATPTTVVTPSNATICDGQSTTLTASGGATYSWNTGATTSSITVSPNSNTTYTVTASNGSCQGNTVTANVSVVAPPTVTVTPSSPTICEGDNITLTASGATSYSWSSGDNTASTTVSPTTTTTYTVDGVDGSCSAPQVSVTVTVLAAPAVAANATPSTVSLSSGATVSFSSVGSGGTSYSWDFGDGNTSTQANPSHTYTSGGTYTVTLTVSDGTCSSTTTLTVVVLDDTSVDEGDISSWFTAYPNPTQGDLVLDIAMPSVDNVSVTVFDVIGKLIYSQQIRNVSQQKVNIDLNGQASGMYYVKVQTTSGTVTKQISVVRTK